jgi:hypothetical protein
MRKIFLTFTLAILPTSSFVSARDKPDRLGEAKL